MAYIIEVPNALEPTKDILKHIHPGGISIRQWLEIRFPGFQEFPLPTVCIVNGEALMRKDWNRNIEHGDVINFVTVPGYFTIVIIVVLVVIALTILLVTVANPAVPGEAPASDPVFSTKGQTNEIRLGEPIECCYGRNRIYPSLASRPYFQYVNNDQYQYSLFCLGQGVFDITVVQIGDTPIAQFQEVEWELIPPGGAVTLFPTNVITSVEAGDQALFAPNEAEYVAPGWVGPFVTNPPGSTAENIQVDVVFPKGIYEQAENGNLNSIAIYFEAEAQLIDDAGAPIGSWFSIVSPSPYPVDGATTTPQRRTVGGGVPIGRYQVRLRRTSDKNMSYRAGNDIVWEGLRAYIDTDNAFGNVTLLAVKIRATNNLNDRTQLRFNVIATRKLPIRSGGAWTVPTATRSIVWAFIDVFKSTYGGRILADSFFDLDHLEALDALYLSRGDNFDWVFRDPITVWEAAKAVARAGRAIPLLVGSLITMKRDEPIDIPVTMFTPENMVRGTFQWDVKFFDIDEFDSISLEYTEPATGYKQEHVLATLPGGTADHPEDIRFPGIQSRAQAYREAMYMVASRQYLRENITFDTGLEGYIPIYGDLIVISHDMPRWGQAGFVVNAAAGSAPDTFQLWLSEPLNWDDSGEYQILLRGRHAEVIGPLTAIQTSDPKQVLVTIPSDSSGELNFLTDGTTEPMLFLFGVAGRATKYAKIVRIEPSEAEAIRITSVNDAPIIHSFDALPVPPLVQPPTPPQAPDLPTIAHLYLTQIDSSLYDIQASWTAAFGAQYYIVQTSQDNVNWTQRAETVRTSIQLQVVPGPLWVRVAAVNNGQGPWITGEMDVGILAGLELTIPWVDLEWAIRWLEVINNTGYQVKVYDSSASALVLKRTTTTTDRTFDYTYAMALSDSNITRHMLVKVDVLFNGLPSGFPAELTLFNSIPLAPTVPDQDISSVESDRVIWHLTWGVPAAGDLIRIKLWLSDVSGFDPNVDVPYLDETVSSPGSALIPTEAYVDIPLDSSGGHSQYYWRVALFDVWGDEIATNITAEAIIPAFV